MCATCLFLRQGIFFTLRQNAKLFLATQIGYVHVKILSDDLQQSLSGMTAQYVARTMGKVSALIYGPWEL